MSTDEMPGAAEETPKSPEIPEVDPLPDNATASDMQRYMAQRKARIQAYLEAEPRVTIHLPEESEGHDRSPVHAEINGLRFSVARGVDVSLPKSVADLILNARTKYDSGPW